MDEGRGGAQEGSEERARYDMHVLKRRNVDTGQKQKARA